MYHPKKHALEDLRSWSQQKLRDGHNAPWEYFLYMKLEEVTFQILEGIAATKVDPNLRPRKITTKGDSPQSDPHQGNELRLVEEDDQQDSSPRHPDKIRVPLPM